MFDIIKLIKRNVYGRVLYYPNCELSRQLVKLTGRKTFIQEDLTPLDLMGLEIIITTEA